MIGEVYEKMDSMLVQIKDIVESKDAILYYHIHKHVVKRWENLSVPLHNLACPHTIILFVVTFLRLRLSLQEESFLS